MGLNTISGVLYAKLVVSSKKHHQVKDVTRCGVGCIHSKFNIRKCKPITLSTIIALMVPASFLTTYSANAATLVSNSVTISAGSNSPDADVTNTGTGERTASLSSNFNISNTPASFTGTGRSASTFGTIRNSVSVDIVNYVPGSYNGLGELPVSASSSISDTLTINDLTKTGFFGYMGISFDVTGNTTLNYTTNLNPSVNVLEAQSIFSVATGVTNDAFPFPVPSSIVQSYLLDSNRSITTRLFQFTYGTPFDLILFNTSYVGVKDNPSPSLPLTDRWGLNATVNFGNTIVLSEISVFNDIVGTQRSSNFNLTAQSGTIYPTSTVPVPAAVWLFFSGLIGLLGMARRKS